MNYRLEKVSLDKKKLLYKLLQYSLFEESENDLNEMNENCEFEYNEFDNYFDNNNLEAFFIKSEQNKILGFVMIKHTKNNHSIIEFMVIPKYRRNSIGKKMCVKLFKKYKGDWKIESSYGSEKAYNFWKNVISFYTKDNYRVENNIFFFSNHNINN